MVDVFAKYPWEDMWFSKMLFCLAVEGYFLVSFKMEDENKDF